MVEINKISGIVVGQYGEAIVLTIVDKNGTAVDISAYTTAITVTLRDPYTLKVVSCTGAFVGTGTDGRIQFTPAQGDIDRSGEWEGQVKLQKASAEASTRVFTLDIDKKLSAT